jgi:hypothetical protein
MNMCIYNIRLIFVREVFLPAPGPTQNHPLAFGDLLIPLAKSWHPGTRLVPKVIAGLSSRY